MMTPEQEQHLEEVKRTFSRDVEEKYRAGQKEHGGDLWLKPGLVDMALEEAVDLFVYLHTLKHQTQLSREGKRNVMLDMDNTLCYGEAWTIEEALSAEPRTDRIERLNKQFEGDFVVVYTARKNELIPATLEWLERHGVRFHAISNKKLGADVYIDDKFFSPSG